MEKTLITFYWIVFAGLTLFIGEYFMLRKWKVTNARIYRHAQRSPNPSSYLTWSFLWMGIAHFLVLSVNLTSFFLLIKYTF